VADLIIYAIPAFVLLLIVELLSFKYARDEELVGYELRDTQTNLSMGGGNVLINAVWKLVVVVIYAALYELSPLRMPADAGGLTYCSSWRTTSPTTGFTASTTRCASSGPATSSITPPSTTTSRPRCARPGRR
jgi:hypothetical protein